MSDWDVVIVGGGSAGCVLAARLSEDADRRVLLIEAGADVTAASMPAAMRGQYPARVSFDPRHTWPGLAAQFGGARHNDPERRPGRPYHQARVLGGGSSINGIGANRGAPSDYDEWAAMGAHGWGWAGVLPYFRKLERDLERDGDLHGKHGPLPIRHVPDSARSGFVRSVVDELAARGFARRDDQNGPWLDGVHPIAVNLDENWERVSTATGYLTPAVRARANLEVMTGREVERIVFAGRRATGVALRAPHVDVVVRAREIVLAAGAIHSPVLLMRSGIGDAGALGAHGIAQVAHLPGVGQNLMEHPIAGAMAFLRPRARTVIAPRYHIPAILRFSSGLENCPAGDMHMAIVARAAWHEIGRRLGALMVWVNKSYSRGAVTLAGPDAGTPPHIDFRLLADHRDRLRLASAFRLSASVLQSERLATMRTRVMPARSSVRTQRFAYPSLRNTVITAGFAALLDAAGPFAGPLIDRHLAGGDDLDRLLADDAALDAYLDEATAGVWHASGTCRMGDAGDPLAVVDPQVRVRGVEGLRVCDAAIFPTIPCANTNVPVIMCAEKIADAMRAR